jgi:hypothetical protein
MPTTAVTTSRRPSAPRRSKPISAKRPDPDLKVISSETKPVSARRPDPKPAPRPTQSARLAMLT